MHGRGGMHDRGQTWQGACMAGVGGGMHGRRVYMAKGDMCGRGHAWWGGTCMAGEHAWQGGVCGRGACMGGGMHGGVEGGVRAMHTPQTLRNMVGQCAGGMHPTGMHSY